MLRAHDFNANLLFHGTSVVKVSSDGTPLVRSLITTNKQVRWTHSNLVHHGL